MAEVLNDSIVDNDLLEKLTIIIPSFERSSFLKRTLKYWSNFKVKIIAVDGSNNSLDKTFLSNLPKNIKYINNKSGFYTRLLLATNLVETEYVMLGWDDEFYIPSALKSCLVNLSRNSDLISCTGRAIAFNYDNQIVRGYDIYPELKDLNLDDANPSVRIKKHFLNFIPAHLFAISKSFIWKIIAKGVFSKEYKFYASFELQFEFLLPFANKSLSIPELMWLRSMEAEKVRGTSTKKFLSTTHSIWWHNEENNKDKQDFIERMKKICLEINAIKKTNHIPDIETNFDFYSKRKKKKGSLFFRLYLMLLKYLPGTIKHFVKRILQNFGYGSSILKKQVFNKIFSLKGSAELLELDGVKVDFNELEKIEKIVSNFHANNKK